MGACCLSHNKIANQKEVFNNENKEFTFRVTIEKRHVEIKEPEECLLQNSNDKKPVVQTPFRRSLIRKLDTAKVEPRNHFQTKTRFQRRVKKINFLDYLKSSSQKLFDNVVKTNQELTDSDKIFIQKALQSTFMFKDLEEIDLEMIANSMFSCSAKTNSFVFTQEENASCFFIIKEGNCEIIANNKMIKELKEGQFFGETALLYNATRNASVRAVTDLKLFALEKQNFQKFIRQISNKVYDSSFECLDQVAIFQFLTKEQKLLLAGNVIVEKYLAGESIVHQDAIANSFYIIQSGAVVCCKGAQVLAELKEGATFGEQALSQKGYRALSVRAKIDTVCLALSSEILELVLGGTMKEVQNQNIFMWAIESQDIFRNFNSMQRVRWYQQSKIVFFEGINTFKKAGHKITQLYVVLDGQLTYGEKVYVKGDFFKTELVHPKIQNDQKLEFDLISNDAKLAMISFENFANIIDSDFANTSLSQKWKVDSKQEQQTSDFRQKTTDMELSDFICLRLLGEGQFGKVFLVFHKKTNDLFALKMINKNDVVEYQLQETAVSEKNVMLQINSPFILKLFRTFKDEKSVYLLTNYIPGVELFDLIRQIDLLGNEDARFYIATLIMILEYIHGKGIIHRDIKPENTIVDKTGYLNLIDFGASKQLSSRRARTHTIIGTPHYMSPEIINGKGYSMYVDLWALGILMFELMAGFVPFGEESIDPYEIYNDILHKKLDFPDSFVCYENENAIDLIKILLNKLPEERLSGSYNNLKSHIWFDNFKWNDLAERKIRAPNIPAAESIISDEEIEELKKKGEKMTDAIAVF